MIPAIGFHLRKNLIKKRRINYMGKIDKRIDAYIAGSADFAKPILNHLRKLVHKACPDIIETMKWSFPHFDYKGIMCAMAGFKQHCVFGFWKGALMSDKRLLEMAKSEVAMGHLGKINSLKDLPSDKILIQYIHEAMRLNENGVKIVRKKSNKTKKELIVPADLKKSFSKNKKAQSVFDGFSHSNKKEYLDWITEAKTEETRLKRLTTAIQWLAEGKIRNWKYAKSKTPA